MPKSLRKIILLGDPGVGKSKVLERFIQGTKPQEQYRATIGADFFTKDLVVRNQDGKEETVVLQMWDTAGQERFRCLGTAFYRGADALVLVHDLTRPQSFYNLATWFHDFLSTASIEGVPDFPVLVLGTKADVTEQRATTVDQIHRFCDSLGRPTGDPADREFRGLADMQERLCRDTGFRNVLSFETSAFTGEGVDEAFESFAQRIVCPPPPFQFVVTCALVDTEGSRSVQCTTIAGGDLGVYLVPKDEEPFGRWLWTRLRETRPDMAAQLKLVTVDGEVLREPMQGLADPGIESKSSESSRPRAWRCLKRCFLGR